MSKQSQLNLNLDIAEFDLITLLKNAEEKFVLDELTKDCVDKLKFPLPKKGEFCFNTAAALIMYIESKAFLLETNSNGENIH